MGTHGAGPLPAIPSVKPRAARSVVAIAAAALQRGATGASSKGRTRDFESRYDGSNPSAPTVQGTCRGPRIDGPCAKLTDRFRRGRIARLGRGAVAADGISLNGPGVVNGCAVRPARARRASARRTFRA